MYQGEGSSLPFDPDNNRLSEKTASFLVETRRGGDSNPRYPFEVRRFSKALLSTTQPPLQIAYFQLLVTIFSSPIFEVVSHFRKPTLWTWLPTYPKTFKK